MSRTVMMYWDCPACGTKHIEGTTYDCPNCGRQRDDDTRFYLDKGPKQYIDNHVVKGADWHCTYCNALNSAGLTTCENCGSPRSEATDDYFTLKHKKPSTDTNPNHEKLSSDNLDVPRFVNEEPKDDSNENNSTISNASGDEPNYVELKRTSDEDFFEDSKIKSIIRKTSDKIGCTASNVFDFIKDNIFGIILCAVGLLGIFGLIKLLTPTTVIGHVEKTQWEYNVEIEELQTFHENGWSVPSGGRVQYTKQEIRTYEKVLDHYESVRKSRTVEDGGHYKTVTKTRTVEDGYDVSYSYHENGDGTATEIEHKTPRYKTETYTDQEWVTDYKTEYYYVQEPVYRDEPVYDTKYYYEIDRWVTARNIPTFGTDKEPYFGEFTLAEKERTGTYSKHYFMTVKYIYKDKEKTEVIKLSEEEWKLINAEIEVTIKTNGLTTSWTIKGVNDTKE